MTKEEAKEMQTVLHQWLDRNFIHGELQKLRPQPKPLELPNLRQFKNEGAEI